MGTNKRCEASIETLEQELAMWDNRIISRIKTLEKDGYIIDHSPSLKNRSHVRTVTNKLQLEEDSFQEWAEEYRKEQLDNGSELPSYYDCFVIFTKDLGFSKPTKKAGRKRIITEPVSDYHVVSQSLSLSESVTITDDNTIDTSETPDTFPANKFIPIDFESFEAKEETENEMESNSLLEAPKPVASSEASAPLQPPTQSRFSTSKEDVLREIGSFAGKVNRGFDQKEVEQYSTEPENSLIAYVLEQRKRLQAS